MRIEQDILIELDSGDLIRGLHAYYMERGCREITSVGGLLPGCVVFYRPPGRPIHHVAIHIATVPPQKIGSTMKPVGPVSIEAGGGGNSTTSPRAALVRSAAIRQSATDRHGRAEWVAVDPFSLL